MRPLSAAEVRGMTNALIPTFTSTAQIERPVETSDGAGGTTAVRSVVAATKCHYYHSAGGRAEESEGTRIEIAEPWTVLVPPGTNVKHKDRLLVDGRTFEVASISGPATVNIIWTLGCEEIL